MSCLRRSRRFNRATVRARDVVAVGDYFDLKVESGEPVLKFVV